MKKNIAIILALAMVITLFAGCAAKTSVEGSYGFGANNFVVTGNGNSSSGGSSSGSSSSSSSESLDPNRTSLSFSASGAKGPESVTGTSSIGTSEFTKPSSLSSGKVTHSGTGMEYFYYKPSTVAPADGYPLFLWLHGTGGSADPFSSLSKLWDYNADILKSAVIIAPCWTGSYQSDVDGYWSTSGKAVTLVKEIISKSTYGKIDANRIYVAGYSAGGMASFREVAVDNNIFAAAAPMAGAATSTTKDDATLKDVPIWGWHGTSDSKVPYDANGGYQLGIGNAYATRAIYNKIGSSGKMRYTLLNGAEHADTPYRAAIDRRLWSWMFQQKKGSVQTKDYTVEGYIKVVDANGKVVMTEMDCSGTPAYDSGTRTFTLTLTDSARTKLTNAYKASGGKDFAVYYGNQKILTYTATGEVTSDMTKFVISGAFTSGYSDENVLARITKGIKAKGLANNYTETVNTSYLN